MPVLINVIFRYHCVNRNDLGTFSYNIYDESDNHLELLLQVFDNFDCVFVQHLYKYLD